MKEPLKYKILSALLMVICKLTGHEYGCCNNVFKRCSKCIYVREDGDVMTNPKEALEWYERYPSGHSQTDDDLISRQDALKPFCIAPDGTRIPEVDCDNFPVEFSVEFIKKHLLSLPSTDVVSRREYEKVLIECGEVKTKLGELQQTIKANQGEWIKTVDGNGWDDWYVLKCPFCGAIIEDKHYHSWEYNFCPNCGREVGG